MNTPPYDGCEKAAEKIISDICDRKGLNQEYAAIEPDIQEEIRSTFTSLIAQHTRAPEMHAALMLAKETLRGHYSFIEADSQKDEQARTAEFCSTYVKLLEAYDATNQALTIQKGENE